jgi:hypothetical protein
MQITAQKKTYAKKADGLLLMFCADLHLQVPAEPVKEYFH